MAGLHNLIGVVVRGHGTAADPRSPAIYNTFFFVRTVLTNAASKSAFYTIFQSSVLNVMYPLLSVNYVMDGVDVRFWDDVLDPIQTFTTGLVNGAVTGDSLPSLMNVSVRLNTGLRGKSYRGSKHFGPIAKSSTLLDQLTSSAQTAWTTAIASLIAPLTDATPNTWNPVCLSRQPPTQLIANPTFAVTNNYLTATLNVDLGRMTKRGQKA